MPLRNGGENDEDKVLANLTDYRLTKHLPEWAKAAGIMKNVTFHTARHSFATSLLTVGVDIYTVSKLLGHTSIRHTQRYGKIINKKKDDAIGLFDQAFE